MSAPRPYETYPHYLRLDSRPLDHMRHIPISYSLTLGSFLFSYINFIHIYIYIYIKIESISLPYGIALVQRTQGKTSFTVFSQKLAVLNGI